MNFYQFSAIMGSGLIDEESEKGRRKSRSSHIDPDLLGPLREMLLLDHRGLYREVERWEIDQKTARLMNLSYRTGFISGMLYNSFCGKRAKISQLQ